MHEQDEGKGENLEGQEATPLPEGSAAEPAPPEPEPKYLTTDEALKLRQELQGEIRRLEQLAREQGKRGAQSLIDKQRLNERMKQTEATLHAMVGDGLLDASQISPYLQRAKLEAIADLATAADEELNQADYNEPPDPYQARALELLKESGLTPSDPEYQTLYGYEDHFAWHDALKKATATKQARIAREQNPQPATSQQPGQQQNPQRPGAAAVEVGSTGGAEATDLATLRQQYQRAVRQGNSKEVARLYEEIRRRTIKQ